MRLLRSSLLRTALLPAFAALALPPLLPAAPADLAYAVPHFADPDRAARVRAVLPAFDRIFLDFAAERAVPGLAWGLVLDGELIHSGATGFLDPDRRLPVDAATSVFRIASMTKSVTALAVLRLRDAGKLALDDTVTRHLPEFRSVGPLTADAPPVTIRHLLVMTAGFPEDNPWGDRQLAVDDAALQAFLRGGVALSRPAGVAFEYSNLGYALLGRIVTVVAGEPYQRYIDREIFRPLGMQATCWDWTAVPPDRLARGYRRENDAWRSEPLLGDGTYGAMGGLLTTIPDFARYAALHLAAYPARPDADPGPLRRASLREMHQPAVFTGLQAANKTAAGEPNPVSVGYGFGLRWSADSRRVVSAGHSGGLPGFGSNWVFYPDHGFAVLAFANLTYAGVAPATTRAAALLLDEAKLPPRRIPASPILARRAAQVAELVRSWDPTLAAALAAENFFPDRSRESWAEHSRTVFARLGTVTSVGAIVPENQLRGTFPIHGAHGRIDVYFTLTPEPDPKLQQLRLTFVAK